MHRWIRYGFMTIISGFLLGQHPFYSQALQQGKYAMEAGDWGRACQLFKMSSFGFLEHDSLLKESLVRLTLSQEKLPSDDFQDTIIRYKLYFPKDQNKPPGLSNQDWNKFCDLAGIERAPGPRSTESEPKTGDIEKIKRLLTQNKLGEAKDLLRTLGLKDPSDPVYMELYAEYCYRSSQFNQVIETFGNLKTRTPVIRYYLGLSYRQVNQDKLAELELEGLSLDAFPQIEMVSPVSDQEISQLRSKLQGSKNQKDWQRFIYLLMEKDNWDEAQKNLKDYTSVFGGNHGEYFEARVLLYEKKFRTAADRFYALTNSGFTEMDVFYYGGLAYLEAGQVPLATYMFQRALKLGSEHRRKIEELTKDIAQN